MSSKSLLEMDAILSELGLGRKSITKDNTCLFRTVSEKLFYTQCWHGRVRDNCLDYLSRHIQDYQCFIDECLETRIQNIRNHKMMAGHLEMLALSRMYKLDFVIFHRPTFHPMCLSPKYHNKIILCSVEDNYFDIVYNKSHIETAGICQSIVYEIVYKGVFGLDSELEEAVVFLELQKHLPRDDCLPNCSLADVIALFGGDKVDVLQRVCGRSCPPVPYRIAKAVHPGLYRNVELDIVQEERRETRQRTLDACKGFSTGDKCRVVVSDNESRSYNAHIQVINEHNGTVGVFIEELGVKKSLPVRFLRPLPLQASHTDDSQSSLPVAELDLHPYLKKGKRRKHQQLRSLLAFDSNSPESCGPSFSSSNSSYCCELGNNSYLGSTTISNIASSTSRLISHSSTTTNCYISTSNIDSPYSVASQFVPEPYLYPSSEADITATSLTSPLKDLYSNSNYLEPLLLLVASPYTSVSHGPGQLATAISNDSSHNYCTMSAPSQGPVYWMPVVAVPYASNLGQAGMGWDSPQEPYGKDLPTSDVKTLHCFLQLGLELYSMPASGQPVTYPAGLMYSPHSSSDINQSMAVVMDTSMAQVVCTETQTNSGTRDDSTNVTCSQGSGDSATASHRMAITFSNTQAESCGQDVGDSSIAGRTQRSNFECGKNNKVDDRNGTTKETHDSQEMNNVGTVKDINKKLKTDDDDDDGSDGMDDRSDGDSGCPSECADLSPVCVPGASEMLQSEEGETLEQTSIVDNPKPRGRRRYYMYGNHKLVKPIKEIPVRFQILLAETSAAKARCEGQPIYMQQHQQQSQQTMYDYVYYPANESAQPQLNVNATCFVPSQDSSTDANMTPTYMSECYAVSPMSGYPNNLPSHMTNANPSSLHPTPMFAPPIPPACVPSHTATSQNCQTIIVYSSHSSSSSASNPSSLPNQQIRAVSMPPLQYPPPTLPPPCLDQMSTNSTPCLSPAANQIPRILPAKSTQSSVSYTDQHMKTQTLHSQIVAKKPSVVLNVPPPSHTCTIQGGTSYNSSPAHVNPNSMTPPHISCRYPYSNPVYLPAPQPLAPSPNMHAAHVNGSSIQTPVSPQHGSTSSHIAGSPQSVAYPGVSANQYMYIYPSPPTGQSAAPPHVVYMVNPAYPPTQSYQQQSLLVPSSCPVPVQ